MIVRLGLLVTIAISLSRCGAEISCFECRLANPTITATSLSVADLEGLLCLSTKGLCLQYCQKVAAIVPERTNFLRIISVGNPSEHYSVSKYWVRDSKFIEEVDLCYDRSSSPGIASLMANKALLLALLIGTLNLETLLFV